MGFFKKKKEEPTKMQTKSQEIVKPEDERLYHKHLRAYGGTCSLCDVRGIFSSSDSNDAFGLCPRHREIFNAEMDAIKSGRTPPPPGISEENVFTFTISREGREVWVKLRLLEFMVDGGEITLEKAREQMLAIVENCNHSFDCENERERKQCEQAARIGETPKTRLY